MSKFKVGDAVSWSSQSGGFTATKTGNVVRVIERWETPYRIANEEFPEMRRMFDGVNIPGGDSTGYLVAVKTGPKAKMRLYLPYPSKLEKVKI